MQPGVHPKPTTTLLVTLSRYLTFLISDWLSTECGCHMAHLARWQKHDTGWKTLASAGHQRMSLCFSQEAHMPVSDDEELKELGTLL